MEVFPLGGSTKYYVPGTNCEGDNSPMLLVSAIILSVVM